MIVPEDGSDVALVSWLQAGTIVSSLLLYPEARAALASAARADRLASDAPDARAELELLWREIERIPVTAVLAERAGRLAESERLRGYDAVHLASLERVGDEDTVMVSADRDLLRAAGALGFMTVAA